MSKELFGRNYFFDFIGKNDEFSERISGLRMSFEAEKNLTELPNPARFTLWNMNPAHREQIEDPEVYCSLNAGYGAAPELIFMGSIVDAYSVQQGVDVLTHLEVRDGFVNWRDEIATVQFAPSEPKAASLAKNTNQQATAKNILEFVAKQMKLPIKFEPNLRDYEFENGFSYYGAAREALARVCKAAGYRWSIQNNVITILSNIWSITDSGIYISSDTGMIGSPERLRRSAKQTAKVKDEETGKDTRVTTARPKFDGWRVTSLLQPTLLPGDYFIVKSKNDPFKNEKTLKATNVRHAGDTHTNLWHTQIEADDKSA